MGFSKSLVHDFCKPDLLNLFHHPVRKQSRKIRNRFLLFKDIIGSNLFNDPWVTVAIDERPIEIPNEQPLLHVRHGIRRQNGRNAYSGTKDVVQTLVMLSIVAANCSRLARPCIQRTRSLTKSSHHLLAFGNLCFLSLSKRAAFASIAKRNCRVYCTEFGPSEKQGLHFSYRQRCELSV